MTQHDREATRRIVTDVEAAEWRGKAERNAADAESFYDSADLNEGYIGTLAEEILILLDTREELKEALDDIHGILQYNLGDVDPHVRSACDIAWKLLSRLRGEA